MYSVKDPKHDNIIVVFAPKKNLQKWVDNGIMTTHKVPGLVFLHLSRVEEAPPAVGKPVVAQLTMGVT